MTRATSPALNTEPRSKDRAALDVAVAALREIGAWKYPAYHGLEWIPRAAAKALAKIDALLGEKK